MKLGDKMMKRRFNMKWIGGLKKFFNVKWFNNMKLTKKLLSVSVVVSVIAGAIGFVGIMNLNAMTQNDKLLFENMVEPMQDAANIAILFQKVGSYSRDMILDARISEIEQDYEEIKKLSAEIDGYVAGYEAKLVSEEGKKAFADFMDARPIYQQRLADLLPLCTENKDTIAIAQLRGMINDSAAVELEAINRLLQSKVDEARDTYEDNLKKATGASVTMLIFILVGMVLSILFGILVSRMISQPVKKLARAADLIADGDLNVDVDIVSKDEIGALAKAFKKMSDTLNEVMTNINSSAEQVASGARQVSESSMVLSQGATEQASSIEQLTASVEEISSQTRLNSDNANEASELAEEAKKNAELGNLQMKQMLTAMDEINESSGNISKIIKVIDEIAFQTNILALNAAVEAARAGQHGKGFAVVAEEVRNLAARSANAAKETTAMIEGSIKKVGEGTKIANHTAEALGSIVTGISTVSALVGNIATASHEQAAGVDQINQGLTQVSTVVQKNSETSEESAAASEELSGQAELLKEQVMKFKLKKITKNSVYKDFDHLDPEIMRIIEEIQRKRMAASEEPGVKVASPEKAPAMAGAKKIELSDSEFGKY